MTNLASRILVIVLLAPVVIGAAWLGGWWLAVLAAVGAVIGAHELFEMLREHRPVVIAGLLGSAGMVLGAERYGLDAVPTALFLTTFLTFILAAAVRRERATVSIAVTLFAASYVAVGLSSLVLLRKVGTGHDGAIVLLAVLLGVWASDIGAYLVGRAIGRRKLAPAISPNKTVEGFVGGLVLGAVTVWYTLYFQHGISRTDAVVVALFVVIASPFGDLFESFLKRDVGVKDSGRLLGGHGGMLDRVDALLFAGPAAMLALIVTSTF